MRTITTAVLAATLLALTACSSGSDDSSEAADTPAASTEQQPAAAPDDTADLTAAVEAYTAAYFKGDADTTYATLSQRCQGKISPAAYAGVVEQAGADYGEQTVKTVTVDQLSGDLARVSYTVSLPKFDQDGQAWLREDGEWRYDAC
ncbi:hypothetical protein ACFVGN_27235 [Streptomyces sp. NPDC057757]|uniref:hypothetical protein n=1 Tax=Streptomyces sp. NPDC057757 TaxID=3346241 RepID=UPI0036B4F5D6